MCAWAILRPFAWETVLDYRGKSKISIYGNRAEMINKCQNERFTPCLHCKMIFLSYFCMVKNGYGDV